MKDHKSLNCCGVWPTLSSLSSLLNCLLGFQIKGFYSQEPFEYICMVIFLLSQNSDISIPLSKLKIITPAGFHSGIVQHFHVLHNTTCMGKQSCWSVICHQWHWRPMMHKQREYCITNSPPVEWNRFRGLSSGATEGVGCCTFVAPGSLIVDQSLFTDLKMGSRNW